MTDARTIVTEALGRANAATEGPWIAEGVQDGTDDGPEDYDRPTGRIFRPHDSTQTYDWDDDLLGEFDRGLDAAFTAAARTDVPRFGKALLAVLELHRPSGPTSRDVKRVCLECIDEHEGWVPYPCATVTAITEALGTDS